MTDAAHDRCNMLFDFLVRQFFGDRNHVFYRQEPDRVLFILGKRREDGQRFRDDLLFGQFPRHVIFLSTIDQFLSCFQGKEKKKEPP